MFHPQFLCFFLYPASLFLTRQHPWRLILCLVELTEIHILLLNQLLHLHWGAILLDVGVYLIIGVFVLGQVRAVRLEWWFFLFKFWVIFIINLIVFLLIHCCILCLCFVCTATVTTFRSGRNVYYGLILGNYWLYARFIVRLFINIIGLFLLRFLNNPPLNIIIIIIIIIFFAVEANI